MSIVLIKNRPYTYSEYLELTSGYALLGKTSGPFSEEHVSATKLNAQRMKRINQQCVINERLAQSVRDISLSLKWIIIAETWCGDGAQNIPVIAKLAELNPLIELKIILRDENPEYMDMFLTNGSRSIPKLVCSDKKSGNVIGTWGPRPAGIQQMVVAYRKEFPGVQHDEFVKNLHSWYAKDKTAFLQEELYDLIADWKIKRGL